MTKSPPPLTASPSQQVLLALANLTEWRELVLERGLNATEEPGEDGTEVGDAHERRRQIGDKL